MKNKISSIYVFLLLLCLIFSQYSFAKYVITETSNLEVYIDKTPPIINIKSENHDENYSKTDFDTVVANNSETTISSSDNVKVDYNEYQYNPTNKDFSGSEPTKFANNTTFTEDGYYKITSVDTSGNKTGIIILIDKTPPDVEVNYFKKGEESAKSDTKVLKVAAIKPKYMTARSSAVVYNETEFRNAINSKVTDIVWGTSFKIGSAVYINYNVTIHPSSNENAMQYDGYGNFLVVQNNGVLNLTSMVVDTNGSAKNRGVTAINVQSGGRVIFREGSIIDGGTTNTGLLINGGGTALFYSGHVANSTKGIVVKSNGNLSYGNLGDGRTSEAWSNSTAISFENFTGTCNFNQSNIRIRNNTNGIIIESNTGKINFSAGQIYNNSSNGIVSKAGTLNISGGSIYSNGNGVNFGAGALNITGGNIYSNKVGVLLNASYTGKMIMSEGKIYSNSTYAINHGQNTDGSCTIVGGTVTGTIYLAQNDNYVNTNSSYPTLTVTPSSYYFKRKLVKTTSNDYANTEISKVTMTPNGSWYKYVEDEYIKVWQGCNVKVNFLDYFGNIISTETHNGNLGDSYDTTAKEFEKYDLISIPENAKGTYTQADIIVEYKYDLKNIAQVKYEDLLSGIQSAKYWFNNSEENFTGDGMEFENNTIFEDYGFYKVEVINNVGLKKELTFSLNKDSLKR